MCSHLHLVDALLELLEEAMDEVAAEQELVVEVEVAVILLSNAPTVKGRVMWRIDAGSDTLT